MRLSPAFEILFWTQRAINEARSQPHLAKHPSQSVERSIVILHNSNKDKLLKHHALHGLDIWRAGQKPGIAVASSRGLLRQKEWDPLVEGHEIVGLDLAP
jgi:hypothetical protein